MQRFGHWAWLHGIGWKLPGVPPTNVRCIGTLPLPTGQRVPVCMVKYPTGWHLLNACATRYGKHPLILVDLDWGSRLDPEVLTAVLYHELGHIHCWYTGAKLPSGRHFVEEHHADLFAARHCGRAATLKALQVIREEACHARDSGLPEEHWKRALDEGERRYRNIKKLPKNYGGVCTCERLNFPRPR